MVSIERLSGMSDNEDSGKWVLQQQYYEWRKLCTRNTEVALSSKAKQTPKERSVNSNFCDCHLVHKYMKISKDTLKCLFC